jgi:hypothetical protein
MATAGRRRGPVRRRTNGNAGPALYSSARSRSKRLINSAIGGDAVGGLPLRGWVGRT